MAKARSDKQQTQLELLVLGMRADARVCQHRLKREYRLDATIAEIQHIIDNAAALELDL
jgi:hypothetical protein